MKSSGGSSPTKLMGAMIQSLDGHFKLSIHTSPATIDE